MPSPYGRIIAVAVFVFTLTFSPYAQAADTVPITINDPLTDTLQLWGAVFQSIESMTQHLASLLQPPLTLDRSPQQQTPKAVGPSVAASVALATQSLPETATTSGNALGGLITPQQPQSTNPPGVVYEQTTHSLFVKSAASASPALPTPASTFITRDQFNAALSNRIDPLIGIVGNLAALLPSLSGSSSATPPWVAGNGNPQILGPAAPINQLSNVTITNPTISGLAASAIPDLSGSYLSRGGGTLSGAFLDSSSASSSFAGALGIGTTSPSDLFALNGAAYFADITAPSVTTNRLYSNSGSLYWNGSVVGGGSVGNWTSSGSNVYRTSGNVGIDTATPSYALDVFGAGHFTSFADASYFVATSSGATTLLNGNLTVNGSTTLGSATSSNLAVTGTASTSALVASNSFTFQNVTGFLKATAGAVATSLINLSSDVTGILPVGNGGTGWSNIAAGAIPYGNGSSALATTSAATAGQVLAFLNGVPTWTATTTLANISGKLAVGQGGTGTTTWQSGSIPFYNGTNFTENNGNLFWDNTNHRLGIGSSTPATGLSVSGNAYITGGLGVGALNTLAGTFNGWSPEFGLLYSAGGNAAASAGTGYAPGDTMTLTGGTPTTEGNTTSYYAKITVLDTTAVSATVNAGGSGGTNGACTITGTTGTIFTGGYAQFSGTVSGGSLSGPLTLVTPGDYTANPTNLSAEPVTGCGLSGATINIVMGVKTISVINPGQYTSIPPNPVAQGSTSGSGSGATFNLSWGPVAATLSGETLNTGKGNFFLGGSLTNINDDPAEVAGGKNTTGVENTYIGDRAGGWATTGSGNTAVGHNAFGIGAGVPNIGYNDVAIGQDDMRNSTSTYQSVFVGSDANHDGGAFAQTIGIGYNALYGNANASSSQDIAIGFSALGGGGIFRGSNETCIGFQTCFNDLSGTHNIAIGFTALRASTGGVNNVAVGDNALNALTGSGATAVGFDALENGTQGDQTAFGQNAGQNNTGVWNTFIGDKSVTGTGSGALNTTVGYNSAHSLTNGNNNILIGAHVASTTTTGSSNIAIGYDIALPSTNGSNQLNIGNLIFGTGINGEGTTVSTGNIGIGTANPYSRLQVSGPDSGASTTAFLVANSASTTEFYVSDNGNAVLAGGLTQNSDQRLKTNIQPLGASSSLAEINALNPVTFTWIDPSKAGVQLGFIAQQVFPIFPNLISTTSATALTPDGTLGLNYTGLIAPIVRAIQALSAQITSIENTIAGFADSFTTKELTFDRATGKQLCLQKSDGSPVCVTGDQLAGVLAGTNAPPTTPAPSGSSATPAPATAPVIHINGDNPAIIHVGDSYSDLGATITGPQADLNLGITTYVNGTATSPVEIETTQAATDTVQYVVTDQNGLTATSTRTVIVEPAQPSSQAVTTTQLSLAAPATSTAATSTAQ